MIRDATNLSGNLYIELKIQYLVFYSSIIFVNVIHLHIRHKFSFTEDKKRLLKNNINKY